MYARTRSRRGKCGRSAGIPLGRAAQLEEIADWVWKLCHGTYLTGETPVVSGGITVR